MTAIKEDAAVKLARYAVNTTFEDFNEEEIAAAKNSLMDTIGCTLAASTLGFKSPELVKYAKEEGGRPDSRVWGFGGKVTAQLAAFANGALNHALDYDQCFDVSGTHPSVSCIPAISALQEKTGNLSGKEFITALIVGTDMIYRIGKSASVEAQKSYGFFAAFIKSYFGAAVAAGKILRLTEEEMINCIGLAYAQTCGNMQVLNEAGSNIREIFPGLGARAGVLAAELAYRGVAGTRDSLEGPGGYFNAMMRGNYDPALLSPQKGDRFFNVELTTKPYPSCRQTHMFIDATKNLMKAHGITGDQVENVVLKVGKFGKVLCVPEENRKAPDLPMDAKFSIPYCVAACLVRGNAGLAEFIPEALKDPEILAMAQKISFEMDDTIDETVLVEAGGVKLTLKDGSVYEEKVIDSLGSQNNPLTREQRIEKFKECCSYSRKKLTEAEIDRIIELIDDLENLDDMTELYELVS